MSRLQPDVTERVLTSTERLTEFPRLYEADPRYGEADAGTEAVPEEADA